MNNFQILALDFESFYGPKFSLTSLTTKQYVLDPRFKVHGCGFKLLGVDPIARWISGHEAVKAYLDTFDWSRTAVLCHNANFDAFILKHIYGISPAFIYDTAAMGRMWEPNNKCGLDDMARRHLGQVKKKDLIRTYGIEVLDADLNKVLGEYCIVDVELMVELFYILRDLIPYDQLRMIDIAVRLHTEPKFVLDVPRITAYRDKERDEAAQKIKDSGIAKTNLSSNDKFAKLLIELGVEVPMKPSPTVEGKMIPAFGKNDLQFQDMMEEYPEHHLLWDARIASKSRIGETRAERFLDARMPDGTISMPLKVAGAHTFRFSGFDSMNVQNMTRGSELRKSLKAPPGYVVCVVDLSNIEARLNAWLSGQDDKVEAFREGIDMYARFASKLFGYLVTAEEHPLQRFIGKTAELGLGYQMGWSKYARVLRSGAMGPKHAITDEEARNTVRIWREENYMITRMWEVCKGFLFRMLERNAEPLKYGPITIDRERIWLPSGLGLHYPGLRYEDGQFLYWNDKSKYWVKVFGGKLLENIIQALANCITAEAILRTQPYLKQIGGAFLLQVHDELVFLVPEKDAADHTAELVRLVVVNPDWCLGLPIAAKGGFAKEYSK